VPPYVECSGARDCGTHPSASTKDESFVVLRGKVKVTTYKDDGSVIESVVLCQEEGRYGVDIKKGVWHNLESLEPDSVIFECKEGPFVPHEVEGVMTVKGSGLKVNDYDAGGKVVSQVSGGGGVYSGE